MKVDPNELVPVSSGPLKVNPAELSPGQAAPAQEPESEGLIDWKKGRLAAFVHGSNRALARALNFSFSTPTSGFTDEMLRKLEREAAPATTAHPGFAMAGEMLPTILASTAASAALPAFAPAAAAAGAVPRLGLAKGLANMAIQAPVGAAMGAAFSPEGQRGTGALVGGMLAPAATGLSQAIGGYARTALPRARKIMGKLLGVDPEEAVAAVGKPGEIVEAAERKMGQKGIEAGLALPGEEPGTRALLAEQRLVQPHIERLNKVVQELDAAGARLDTNKIVADLYEVTKKHFGQPGTQNVGPIMKQGRVAMNSLIEDIAANPDLWQGARFSNFLNLKRVLQAKWGNVSEPGFAQAIQKAANDAASVVRKHTEAAANRVSPALGAEFKAANQALHENIPIAQGTLERAMNALRLEREPGLPHIAASPMNLAHRTLWGRLIHTADPYRVGWNQAVGQAYPHAQWMGPLALPGAVEAGLQLTRKGQ